MKVTLLTGEYPPMRGGVADYSALLAEGLSRLGVEVSVLTSVRARASGPTPVTVIPTVKGWGARMWSDVWHHVASSRPDLIHVQYQTGAFDMQIGVNVLPWLLRMRGGKPPVVVTFHDLKEPYLLPKLGALRHIATMVLAAGADGVVITNSEDLKRIAGRTADRAALRWGRRPVRAIPIGSNIPPVGADYDRSRWRERIGARQDDLVLAYFGFLGLAKGVDTLVASFRTLLDRGRPVRLLMVGAATGDTGHPDRSYENQIRTTLDQPGLRGRVTWTGFLASESVGAYLRAADVCILPFREGTSLRHGTLIAAIVHGLPIVTTTSIAPHPRDELPRLVSERNVMLVAPNDSASLVLAIERLLAEPKLRQTLGDGAQTLAPSFHWDAISRETLRLYEAVAGRPA
jgi:glycosyltransferase involved in cell wall biosynthesis